MRNEELKRGMEVSVEYDGKWQLAKVIGPVTRQTGNVIETNTPGTTSIPRAWG